jgi:hypothetical protein
LRANPRPTHPDSGPAEVCCHRPLSKPSWVLVRFSAVPRSALPNCSSGRGAWLRQLSGKRESNP